MDTQSFTTATAKADWLENRKAEIDERVDGLKQYRDSLPASAYPTLIANIDRQIDTLLAKKDSLAAGIWEEEAEAQADDYADEKATQESALCVGLQ